MKLTKKQLTVTRLVVRGMTDQEIADELNISKRTVNFHIRNLLSTVKVNNRVKLAVWAIKNGLDTPEEAA